MIFVNHQEKLVELPSSLHSPIPGGSSVYVASSNGEILQHTTTGTDIVFKCNGQPSCLALDEAKNCFYVGDLANQSVLAYTVGEE